MKILAVDDSPTMLEILSTTLVEAGHEVTPATDGAKAVKQLAEDIDLIISDLNMINMSGFELLRHVRESGLFMAKPFIFLTTENDEELKGAAREAGATAWMVKPFDPSSLLSLVSRFAPVC